ncbi:MAG: ATP-dependent DNA helicase [Wenzhouxiangella sp.]
MTELARQFAGEGPLAELLPGFRPRPGQIELAERITACLDQGRDLVAEAATGTGKTLAYLLPVLAREGRSIISTGTLNLQDQLFNRDLPLALKASGVEKRVALLKGRANYLCPQRLQTHLDEQSDRDSELAAELREVARWARHSERGEISEIESISARSPVWPLVTSTQDNCLGSDCPMLKDCPLAHARRKAQDADIVVVNHHLLFADMALKHTGFGEVLPGADAVIIDEAHQVPETAMRFFSRGVSAWQVKELARDSLAACGQAAGSLQLLRVPIQALRDELDQCVSACVDLPPRGDHARLTHLQSRFESLAQRLGELKGALDPVAEQTREMGNCADRAGLLLDGLRAFMTGEEGTVRWFTNRRGRFSLQITPLDIAGPLTALREHNPATWIMTSATLAVARRFDHFTRRLGLDDADEVIIASPFDYANQTRLWLPTGLPEPRDPGFGPQLLEQVMPLLRANGGRAFLLFTAHRALNQAAEWLRAHSDFHLLVQEEAPRQVLLQRFLDTPRSLLLGAASFWEGVDVPGPALSLVIIDKLPFASPDDPVLEATMKAVREAGESPFSQVQLPQAVLALKQGVGRLIRQADDFGVLVIGDPRLKSKSYGRLFLNSLPPMTPVDSGAEAAAFLRQKHEVSGER